ncbi:MAG: hypothetical protein CMO01_01780 [Thalassobius sp.]|nr:hypothetical protein [Thalassovita sp.]
MLRKSLFSLSNWRAQSFHKLDKYFQKNPKRTVLIMLAILVIGVGFIIIKRAMIKEDTTRMEFVEEIMDSIPEPDSSVMFNAPSFQDFQEIREMEAKLNAIMKKDKLTKEDSLFMLQLNEKLNKMMNYEKD